MSARGRLIAVAGLLLAGSAGCQGASGPVPLELGHVADLSGSGGAGVHAERGISLALHQLREQNLAAALFDRQLEVRHTDTRGQLDAYESEAVRLAKVERVAGLLGGRTPAEVARLDRAHVPLLTAAGVRPVGASDLVFAAGMRPEQQAAALAKFAAADLGLRDVVVLADERRVEFVTAGDRFARLFTKARPGQDQGPATLVVRFGKDAKWGELAKRIVERKAVGALLFAGTARDWLELRRQHPFGLPLLFAGDDGDGAHLLATAGKDTIYVATAFAAAADAPRSEAFVQKYHDAYGADPDVAAALAYESLQLFAEALKQAGPTFSADKVRDALRALKDFPGLAGTLTMGPDQYVRRPLYVARAAGTRFAAQKRYEPEALPASP